MHSDSGPGEQPDTPDFRTDAQLLSAHVDGDRHAFAELVSRHHGRLYRVARRTCRSPRDASEAMQDALLAAHRYAGPFGTTRPSVAGCIGSSERLPRSAPPQQEGLHEHPGRRLVRGAGSHVAGRHRRSGAQRPDATPVEQRAAAVAVDMQGLLGGRYRRAARCRPGHSEEPPRQGRVPGLQ